MSDNIQLPFAFFQGKIIPTDLARVSIMTNALQYGNGLFGGIRGYISSDKKNLNIFRLEDHYARFLKSLKIINKQIPYSQKKLVEITLELARKNNIKSDCYFRPFAYGSGFNISPDLSQTDFEFALYVVTMGEYLSVSNGLKLAVSSWVRINDNMIPSRGKLAGGYINSSLAKADAVRLGYDDAVMLTFDGHVAEATAANIFIIRDGVLITPSKFTDILEGITRRTILQLAGDLNVPSLERTIDRSELYVADEVFLSGTGAQISFVKEIDGRIVSNGKMGPITAKIQKLFFNIVRNNEKKYSSWLTRI